MTAPAPASARVWFWAAVALTLLKLWLTRGLDVYALGGADHDDALFVRLAQHLVRGEWLGPYDQLTLAKGPAYPVFIAAAFWAGLPLFLAQQLLYAGACAALVRAVRPALASAAGRFGIFALLLVNPMSYDTTSLGRVLRQHLQVPLALLVLAGFAALLLRRGRTLRQNLGWCLLLGAAWSGLYLTREDDAFLLPSIALLGGAWLWLAWRDGARRLADTLKCAGVVLLAAAIPVLGVSLQNYRHYGWFGTVEFRAAEFKDAYGALARIRPAPTRTGIPVSREAREAAYAVSPAFAELRPHLEGPIGLGWAEASAAWTGIPASERQIGGGWFMWALRDAVAAAGHARSARTALAYYRRVADEVNAAGDERRLPAGPPRRGFRPQLQPGQLSQVISKWWEFAGFTARFSLFGAKPSRNEGTEEQLQLFRDLTRERIAPAEGSVDPYLGLGEYLHNLRAANFLHAAGQFLAAPLFWLIMAAHAFWLWRAIACLRARDLSVPFLLAAAAWLAAAAALFVQALVELTSFPVKAISSFAVVYPLWLLFAGAATWDFIGSFRRREARKPERGAAPAAPLAALPRHAWSVPVIGAVAALLPFVLWQTEFRKLFWFADDLFLVDQHAQMGFGKWTFSMFAENFVPLFKLLWGGALLGLGGSYAALLWLLWLTHALNTALLGRLLFRAGLTWPGVAFAMTVFALPVANLETLGWSVQWSAILALTFFLGGLLWHETHAVRHAAWNWHGHAPLVLFATASALCFSRGVLTGGVLAAAMLLPLLSDRTGMGWRMRAALTCLVPALLVAVIITQFGGGNSQRMAGHWDDALHFALTFLLLNPGHLLFGEPALGSAPSLAIGALKIAVLIAGFALARGGTRRLLLLLFLFDVGNALILGIGRHHTGLIAATGSRYCYGSLAATLPFAAVVVTWAFDRIMKPGRLRPIAAAALLLLVAGLLLWGWPRQLPAFTGWRGVEMRQLMQRPYITDPAATVPALDFMHLERAKALQRAYRLH
jgi:hypothetical protein